MTTRQKQKESSIETLSGMISRLGFAAEISAKKEEEEGAFTLEVKTEEPGRLIGRKGHYLHSLELLLNRIMRKEFDECAWVGIEVDGYQKKDVRTQKKASVEDEERFEKIALDTAKEVKRWGQERRIGPFSAAERRIIHMTLKDDPEVTTESDPEEAASRKKIIIKCNTGKTEETAE